MKEALRSNDAIHNGLAGRPRYPIQPSRVGQIREIIRNR